MKGGNEIEVMGVDTIYMIATCSTGPAKMYFIFKNLIYETNNLFLIGCSKKE